MDVKSGNAGLLIQASMAEPKVTEEKKAKALIAPKSGVVEKKEPEGAGTSVKAEYQMSGTAQQANLSNQLHQNKASNTSINTGDGADIVVSLGDSNQIATGNDSDYVGSTGNKNEIIKGLGDDIVRSTGYENIIRTGYENDNTQLILNELRDVTQPVSNANDQTQLILDIIILFNRVRSSVSGDDYSRSITNIEDINNHLKRLVEALPISAQAQSKMISEVLVLFDRIRADEAK